MDNEVRLIDANALKEFINEGKVCDICENKKPLCVYSCDFPDYVTPLWEKVIDSIPTIVERPKSEFKIDELVKWLNEIVFYNSKNDLGVACLEIIGRLDGFENFVADMRKETNDDTSLS